MTCRCDASTRSCWGRLMVKCTIVNSQAPEYVSLKHGEEGQNETRWKPASHQWSEGARPASSRTRWPQGADTKACWCMRQVCGHTYRLGLAWCCRYLTCCYSRANSTSATHSDRNPSLPEIYSDWRPCQPVGWASSYKTVMESPPLTHGS